MTHNDKDLEALNAQADPDYWPGMGGPSLEDYHTTLASLRRHTEDIVASLRKAAQYARGGPDHVSRCIDDALESAPRS